MSGENLNRKREMGGLSSDWLATELSEIDRDLSLWPQSMRKDLLRRLEAEWPDSSVPTSTEAGDG